MSRIDRYIFREVLIPTLIALIALTGVLVGRQINTLLELIVRWSPDAGELWQLLGGLVPPALMFTIPTAVLVGILTGFGRMSSDSETVAFRAAGFSTARTLRPVLLLASMAWVLNLLLSIWIAPAAVQRLGTLTRNIASRQMALQLQPRVFNEDLGSRVLYVEDVSPDGTEVRGVLLADVSTPDETQIILAESGRLAGDGSNGRYEFVLNNGSTHLVSRLEPEAYSYSRFTSHALPVLLNPPVGAADSPAIETDNLLAIPTDVLWQRMAAGTATSIEAVEFHRRMALPFACLAFALIGFPLGLSTHRGGRSMGLVISTLLMLAYYMFFIGGTRFAEGARMSPFVGTWGANLAFAGLGVALLIRSERERRNRALDFILDRIDAVRNKWRSSEGMGPHAGAWAYSFSRRPKWFRTLDVYVLKAFWFFFALVLLVFVTLFVVVTFFELLPDIVENDVGLDVIGGYFFYLLPQIVYWVSPLAVLVAALVSLGTLTKANETLAVKAGAISLYRMTVPVLLMAALLSGATYFMQDFLLPETNREQDAYRNTIKGRAAQSYRDPLRRWMRGTEDTIYYYSYFDPDSNVFYDLTSFTFDPSSYSLTEWTFTTRARWEDATWKLEEGWTRSVDRQGRDTFESFSSLDYTAMPEGPEYFKKEVRVASQMTYPELRGYIDDLANSGFDVSSLTVDLYRKLSFPLVTLIMAVIAIPFSFTTGRRGAFYGIGLSIIIGISYWGTFEVFDNLGGISQLSPVIAAWFPNLIFGFSGFWMLLKIRT